MASPDGPEQQGFRRGDSGCGSDRTPGGHPRGHRAGGGRRCRDLPRARGGTHTSGTGDGCVDQGRPSAETHGEGTGMTVLSDRVDDLETYGVAEHRGLRERSWCRPSWTVAELESAKKGRTVSVG